MKYDNQLRYAVRIIAAYHGEIPLQGWLKSFFREHKQMGSHDRRVVADLVYGFYRLGHALPDAPVQERLLAGLFLCHDFSCDLLGYFKPEWNGHSASAMEEKLSLCRAAGLDLRIADIFPWKEELSEGVDHHAFCMSFLRRPDLFLRIRPGYETIVPGKIGPSGLFMPPFSMRLPNGFRVEDLLTPDKEVVVQDLSSQRIAPFIQEAFSHTDPRHTPAVWDACAGSGGKSLLVHDLFPDAEITVSDIRESILHNLRGRFRTAGMTRYRAFIADLASTTAEKTRSSGIHGPYDLVIADVPCSGSGTWSRTPEELYFFKPEKIGTYRHRQEKIAANVLEHLGRNGHLIYCTCSVFKKENEDMSDWITRSFGGNIHRQELIKGYGEGADSMFAARLGGFQINCG
ncbi:MAG: Fmu (Sun) domain-containing protein [Bacteroidota bacterium]|nr:Fmu (Sun) domain-containing protein [Bacteroidota bacterium]